MWGKWENSSVPRDHISGECVQLQLLLCREVYWWTHCATLAMLRILWRARFANSSHQIHGRLGIRPFMPVLSLTDRYRLSTICAISPYPSVPRSIKYLSISILNTLNALAFITWCGLEFQILNREALAERWWGLLGRVVGDSARVSCGCPPHKQLYIFRWDGFSRVRHKG